MSDVRLLLGDSLELLKGLDTHSVDAVVTDPPYNLTFMGKEWDNHSTPAAFQAWCAAWGAEGLRVLKPGGHLVAFGGTRTYHRLTSGLEDAGFEIRDCLMWAFGSGFPKSLDVGKAIDKSAGAEREVIGIDTRWNEPSGIVAAGRSHQRVWVERKITAPATEAARKWAGFGTNLKPSYEPAVLARAPLDGTVAANVQRWGTGALNIDGCRVGTDNAGAGRWPPNLLLDGSPEVEGLFPDTESGSRKAGEYGIMSGRGISVDASTGPMPAIEGDSGSAARFFPALGFSELDEQVARLCYTAKADAAERGAFNVHPTVKPLALMRWLVKLVAPRGALVLDPFMGSGSTGLACRLEGMRFVGMEREEAYMAIAERRMGADLGLLQAQVLGVSATAAAPREEAQPSLFAGLAGGAGRGAK